MSNIACRDIIVEVTQEDIDNGEVLSSETCPLALALRRQIPNATIIVCEDYSEGGDGLIEIYLGDWLKTWKSSKTVLKFVKDFDEHRSVKPHIFYLKGGEQRYITYQEINFDISVEFTEEELAEIYGV